MTLDTESTSLVADRALECVVEGSVVGLGSGRSAAQFIAALGRRVREGLTVRGVPTSLATAEMAAGLGIPLVSLDAVDRIDVTVDGADEVDPLLNLIKGLGAALVREKIVAAASGLLVILVGEEKLVETLGERGVLPVEVVPFGLSFCRRRLAAMGFPATLRLCNGRPLVTDNGNHVLDCVVPPLTDPAQVERSLKSVPGVVGTGLFLGMADVVLVQRRGGVEVRTRNRGGVSLGDEDQART